jgi:5-methylthioadenosine/S-adenosylhomocysteine deaminase
LGTDGAASNNGLDLFSDMKLASLLQKQAFGDPKRMPLQELFDAATRAGHEFFGDGAECLKAGASADFVLINIDKPSMTPCHNLVANLVYSGEGAAVDTVFCAGAILMEHGSIEGSGQVVNEARRRACSLAKL